MDEKAGPNEARVSVEQLQVGMFIRLPISWRQHPFLFRSFKIKNEKQIQTIRGLGIAEVFYDPAKSDRQAIARAQSAQEQVPPLAAVQVDRVTKEMWDEKNARTARLNLAKQQIHQCEKHYLKALSGFRSVLKQVVVQPGQVLPEATALVTEISTVLVGAKDVVMHLMGDHPSQDHAQCHVINVSVLSMLLGREARISHEEMKMLGLGCLFHDIGKVKVPAQLLQKATRSPAEEALYRRHAEFGADIMQRVAEFPAAARDVILQHHEAVDGSGYPAGLTGEHLSRIAKILAITNCYDNLCNDQPATAMTPAEAISHMFKNLQGQFDVELLKIFIRTLGIYPPGTCVQLSNGQYALVMSVNPNALLLPCLLVHDREIPKAEALILDMALAPELSISRSLRPAKLPAEVFEYLSPRTRINYFVDKDGRNMG